MSTAATSVDATPARPVRKLESVGQLDREVARARARADGAVRAREACEHEIGEARAERADLEARIGRLQGAQLDANRAAHICLGELEDMLRLQDRVHARAEALARGDNPTNGSRAADTVPAVGPDQRRAPRAPMAVDVTLDGDTNFYVGFSENISSGGIFVATHHTRPIGERFRLQFTLPGGEDAIVSMVEVAWVREPDATDELRHGMPGLGLRFAGISAAAVAAIKRFCESREALFFPEYDEYDVIDESA